MEESNVKAVDLDEKEEPFRLRRKKYLKELNEIKEFYYPKKYRRASKHKHWKEDWIGFVENTYPWDGSNIFTIIVYRLEVLAANLKYFSHHVGSASEVKEIEEAIAIGRKLMDEENYRHESSEYSARFCKHFAYIYSNERELLAKIETAGVFSGQDIIKRWLKENNSKRKNVSVSFGGEWQVEGGSKIWVNILQRERRNESRQSKIF